MSRYTEWNADIPFINLRKNGIKREVSLSTFYPFSTEESDPLTCLGNAEKTLPHFSVVGAFFPKKIHLKEVEFGKWDTSKWVSFFKSFHFDDCGRKCRTFTPSCHIIERQQTPDNLTILHIWRANYTFQIHPNLQVYFAQLPGIFCKVWSW